MHSAATTLPQTVANDNASTTVQTTEPTQTATTVAAQTDVKPVPAEPPAEIKKIGNFIVGKPFLSVRFRLGKTKGKGTFGKVKQGTHEPTGEKVSSSTK